MGAVRYKDRQEKAISNQLSYRETDIAKLVKRFVSGDVDAFGEIYSIYLDRIYRYVFYQVRNKMVAEDLTEEIFMKAWKAIGSYKEQGRSFSAWLYRIAHNHIVDDFRSRRQNLSLDTETAFNIVRDCEQAVECRLTQQEVLELLSYLPDQQKQVIILKFIEGLDNKDIEEITGKSQGAIRITQMRALANLRQRAMREGYENGY